MIIFSPGPSNISDRVRQALLAPEICHRDEEFAELLRGIRARILDVAGVGAGNGYESVVYTGSGSVAIESVVAAARPIGKLLVTSNGPYGERAAAMARYHRVDVQDWELEWGAAIDPATFAERIARSGARAVYLVHHETATGRLNPLRELAEVAKANGCLVLVDTVSSLAGEELDVAGWQLDAVIGSANKCIRGVPGAAFVVASHEFLHAAARQQAAHYANLAEHFAAENRGETPFTPAVQVFFACHAALQETLDEGLPNRRAHFRTLMHTLQDRMHALEIDFLLPDSAYGHTLLSCHLPAGFTFNRLHRELKARGYVIYAAQGALRSTAFRLGLVGHFGLPELTGFLDAFALVLAQ